MEPSAHRCTLRVRKWDGSMSKIIPLERLGPDHFGCWYRWPAGEAMVRRSGPPVHHRRDQILLVPDDGHWIARWALDGDHALYCDVTTPVTADADGTLHTVDLDLDVVRYRRGRVAVIDQDQFESRRRTMGYPGRLVDQARATARWLHRAVETEAEPFRRAGPDRLSPISAAQVADVTRRLVDRLNPDDPVATDVVERLVHQATELYRHATVTAYLPLLIERAARRGLSLESEG
jgi:hypothetical protein